MTAAEFESFRQWSAGQQAKELMEAFQLSEEAALEKAIAEISEMLPDGILTPENYLMTIEETNSGETAGFIWTLHEEFEGRKQSFLCDFAIWEAKRRKGYAAAALRLAETHAAQMGCQESVLFVSDHNEAAKALYHKSGYRVLRQKDYGKFMIKTIG